MSRVKESISQHSLLQDSDDEVSLPPFPVDALPEDMRIFSEEICRVRKSSHEMVIPTLLGLIGALAGRSVYIRGTGEKLRINSYTIISAKSGSGKSYMMNRLIEPIIDFEKEIQQQWKLEIPSVRTRLKEIEERYPDDAEITEDDLKKKEELLRQLQRPKLYVEDITSERLIERLNWNDETILILSSDGRKWISNTLGAYKKEGTDVDIYLKGYTGEPHDTERKDKDTDLRLDSPCISIVVLVQPDKVEDLLKSRELSDSGFLPRSIIIDPDLEPQERSLERMIPDENKLRIGDEKLLQIGRAFYRQEREVLIDLEEYAFHQLVEYDNEDVRDRKTGGKYSDIPEFASRWTEMHTKIIGQLHIWKHGEKAPSVKVTVEDVKLSKKILEWIKEHQLSFLEGLRFYKAEQKKRQLIRFLEGRGSSADRSSILRGTRIESAELDSLIKGNPDVFQCEIKKMEGKKRPSQFITLMKR